MFKKIVIIQVVFCSFLQASLPTNEPFEDQGDDTKTFFNLNRTLSNTTIMPTLHLIRNLQTGTLQEIMSAESDEVLNSKEAERSYLSPRSAEVMRELFDNLQGTKAETIHDLTQKMRRAEKNGARVSLVLNQKNDD
ncbi:hypothetical protein HYV11_02075 [Candidatus Dependentiae bacterium]|nr:hypothetical protein [Candidatus Dependentiae bacterium]